jgi:hypothetical protein
MENGVFIASLVLTEVLPIEIKNYFFTVTPVAANFQRYYICRN